MHITIIDSTILSSTCMAPIPLYVVQCFEILFKEGWSEPVLSITHFNDSH